MVLEFMELVTIMLFILVLVVFPIIWIGYITIKCWKLHTECKRQEKAHAFYRSNYTVDGNGNKRLNGAWHK